MEEDDGLDGRGGGTDNCLMCAQDGEDAGGDDSVFISRIGGSRRRRQEGTFDRIT